MSQDYHLLTDPLRLALPTRHDVAWLRRPAGEGARETSAEAHPGRRTAV